MDWTAGPVESSGDPGDSANMRIIKETFAAIEESGLEAGIEILLAHSHDDCVFRPYTGAGRALRSAEEVRTFFREQLAAGAEVLPRPASFEERGDEIVVKGSLRVVRPEGGFSESQLTWTYRFREGRVAEAVWGPREAA